MFKKPPFVDLWFRTQVKYVFVEMDIIWGCCSNLKKLNNLQEHFRGKQELGKVAN